MTLTDRLTRAGFDAPRTGLALRTALAASLAFVLAWTLGLEHPQWAGMTVWAASQPVRGQLLEKSFFRVAGTISGTLAGIALVMASTVHPALLVGGLALWVGLCTGIGNLQRGFVAYGTVLAGYTAAMVSLLDSRHPDHVLALGADRLATVLVGVLVATVAGYALARPADGQGLRRAVTGLLADLLDLLAAGGGPEADRAVLSRMAGIEAGLDPHGAGSFRSRREVRGTRAVLLEAIPLLLWRHATGRPQLAPAATRPLATAATALRGGHTAQAEAALSQALQSLPAGSELHGRLDALTRALTLWARATPNLAGPAGAPSRPVILHRDWVGAREAMLRAAGAILVFGAIWLATGWSVGGYMLLGLTVMLSLFSTFDSPVHMMRSVMQGQALGILAALTCRWMVWPLAGSEAQMILLTLPFILLGPLLVGHRRTTRFSFDYNMTLLLVLQPHWPLSGSLAQSLTIGLAVLAGPLGAMLAYRTVYPASLHRRIDALLASMLHDLAALAADPGAPGHAPVWRSRLYHRTLRLVRLSEGAARARVEALDAAVAVLGLGQAILRCHELLADPATPPAVRRALRSVLARARALPERPDRAERALTLLARRLDGTEGRLMRKAAAEIAVLLPPHPAALAD